VPPGDEPRGNGCSIQLITFDDLTQQRAVGRRTGVSVANEVLVPDCLLEHLAGAGSLPSTSPCRGGDVGGN
jgi:hypothetical protein